MMMRVGVSQSGTMGGKNVGLQDNDQPKYHTTCGICPNSHFSANLQRNKTYSLTQNLIIKNCV